MLLRKISWPLLLCPSLLVFAEETIQLDDVEVSADPLSEFSDHIVRPVSVLRRTDLEKKNNSTIGDLVNNEPGVSMASFGSGVGRPVIRGQSGGRVGVMSDGISSMDVSTISPDHGVTLNPLFVDQVEVLRGPATLLYGSGASGGLVNVISNRILDYVPDGLEGEAYGHYGFASNDKMGGLRLDFGHGEFNFHLDTLNRGSNNIEIPGFERSVPREGDRPGELQNSDVKTHEQTFGASWVDERGFVGFSINNYANDYGIPGIEESGVRIKQDQNRFDLKGEFLDPLPGISLIKTRWGYNDHEHQEVEDTGEVGTQLDNREWQGRVELLHNLFSQWDGVIGLQYQNRDLDTSGEEAFLPNSKLDSIGLFFLQRRDVDRWHLEFGGRYEHQSAETVEQSSDIDHDLFSFSAGAGYHWKENLSSRLSFTRSQRAPGLETLFSNGAHLATNTFEIGKTNLTEETTHSLDLTTSKTGQGWNGELTLFGSWIDNYIFAQESDRNGDGIADRVMDDFSGDVAEIVLDSDALLLVDQNQLDARFYGLELQTRFNILKQSKQSLDFKLWADYVRGKLSNDQNLPRITPWHLGLGLDYQYSQFDMSIDAVYTGRQTKLASLETESDPYTELSVNIDYSFLSNNVTKANWFLRGTNLLDETIRPHISFVKDIAPLQGRSIMTGLRFQF